MITSVNCDLFLYADDSTLLVGGKNPAVIQNALSLELNAIRGWLEEINYPYILVKQRAS